MHLLVIYCALLYVFKIKKEESNGTRKNKREVISRSQCFHPHVCLDNVEILDTDTSPLKTMTVFQRVLSTVQIERPDVLVSGAVLAGGPSSDSDEGVSVSEGCAEKLQSFSEVEMSKLVDLGGNSKLELWVKQSYKFRLLLRAIAENVVASQESAVLCVVRHP